MSANSSIKSGKGALCILWATGIKQGPGIKLSLQDFMKDQQGQVILNSEGTRKIDPH